MALAWGLACGFSSPLPYFYVLFFTAMITHRQWRDEQRCREKYGREYWDDVYTKQVPNVFLPSSKCFRDFLGWCWRGLAGRNNNTVEATSEGGGESATKKSKKSD